MFERFKTKIIMLKGEQGASGDYNGLTNKPQINGVTLYKNKTAADLGLASAAQMQAVDNRLNNILANNSALYAGIEMHTYTSDPAYMTYDNSHSEYLVDNSWTVPAGSVILETAWAIKFSGGSSYQWRHDNMRVQQSGQSVYVCHFDPNATAAPSLQFVLQLTVATPQEIDLSELTDLRTDTSGTVHTSAGASIRSMIVALQNQIIALQNAMMDESDYNELADAIGDVVARNEPVIVQVTATVDSETGVLSNASADKTFSYIWDAFWDGAPIYMKVNQSNILIPINYCYTINSVNMIGFSKESVPDPADHPENRIYANIGMDAQNEVNGIFLDTITRTR